MAVRRKCFISYHQADEGEVRKFIDDFDDVFIAKELGVTDDDDFIDSDDTDYVMRRIRELYLTDSTVTIAMVGGCTWARRYVDWEVQSSLRDDPVNQRSGLLAITLPSLANKTRKLPARVDDNVIRDADANDTGYARWVKYPMTASGLRNRIEEVYDLRDKIKPDNSRERRRRNSSC